TKKDAKDELRTIEDQVSKGCYIPLNKASTFKEVAEQWLEFKKPYIRETTWNVYNIHVDHHFKELADVKISKVTTPAVESWISKRQGEKMNLSTMRKILVTFNQVMAYAVRHKMIDSNPVRDAERPRKSINDNTGGGITVLDPGQIRALLEATPGQKYKTLFMTAIMTGARQGEILGLKWSDVDFKTKQIHIRRTFNHQRFFPPKTRESIRAIDCAPSLIQALASWKLVSPQKKDDALVFANEAGEPMNYSNMVQRHFQKALKTASIERIRFHDLRHTYASLLIQQGENIKYIQSQLGHSSPTVTLNVYAHLMKSENQAAACRLENTIFSVDGSKMVAEN
ncbi:MAG TPA: site-specific integrase, partial [Deltaproteobacteria bacterium]|nr:site-specific integrase [Deltaproteobacteria bacterium]